MEQYRLCWVNVGTPPRNSKIVVESWNYARLVYTSGEEAEISEMFSKLCEKVNFPWNFQKCQHFLENFHFSSFLVETHKDLHYKISYLLLSDKNIRQIFILLNCYLNCSRCFPKISGIFITFQIVLDLKQV